MSSSKSKSTSKSKQTTTTSTGAMETVTAFDGKTILTFAATKSDSHDQDQHSQRQRQEHDTSSSISEIGTGSGEENTARKNRHCAFCLCSIAPQHVKVCSKCHRRAYCGRECQLQDWKLKPRRGILEVRGQGHKHWCGLPYCEEGIDWEVSPPVEGKQQMGIIALRPIPNMSRIMVDARQDVLALELHPGEKALAEARGDTKRMVVQDAIGEDESHGGYICMRISRLRNRCVFDAAVLSEKEFGVTILFADRDIAAGEEIFITNMAFNNLTAPLSGEARRRMLRKDYGHVCPLECPCRKKQIMKLVMEARKLDREMPMYHGPNAPFSSQPELILQNVSKLLKIFEVTKPSWLVRQRVMMDGARAAAFNKKNRQLAKDYWEKCAEISRAFLHPMNSENLWFAEVLRTNLKSFLNNEGRGNKQTYENEENNWNY